MFKIVERDWLMNLRGTGYPFDKTNDYKRMKQNNGKRWFFYNTMKDCNVNINDNIFRRKTIFSRALCYVRREPGEVGRGKNETSPLSGPNCFDINFVHL